MTYDDRDLDRSLRLAMSGEALNVSQLLSRVREEMKPSRSSHARAFLLSGIAATLLIAIVSVIWIARPIPAARIVLAADAACDHYDEIIRLQPKNFVTSPADVDARLSGRFGRGADLVAQLQPRGASFEKVAVCRLVGGNRYAHFVYRSAAGGRISVFVRLNGAGEDSPSPFDYHADRYGLQVATFSTPRYQGFVVSTLPSDESRAIGDDIAGRLRRT
jgi:hypothetical protein